MLFRYYNRCGIMGLEANTPLLIMIAHERADHLDRHLRIRAPGKVLDHGRVKPRPTLRHIKAAVAGEPREHHLDKAERRSLAPGGDVAHGFARPLG